MKEFAPVFEQLSLTNDERKLISPFFTNLDESVFSVTFLPPEVIGALCSRTSRAKDDLRIIFLNEFVKPFLGEDSDYAKSLDAFIKFLHENPLELIFSNPKARQFYITWLAEYGDDSIAQMAGSHLLFSGISQVAIKHLEEQRIGIAPLEKSTRYVDYSSKIAGSYRYYTDPTLAQYGLMDEYKQVMDNLFETYTTLLAKYLEHLRIKFPGEEERVLKTKAFDTVRTILPNSTLSTLALFSNGQSFEYMVNRCLDHNLGEIRWTGQRALEELSKITPGFFRRTGEEGAKKYREYLSGRSNRVEAALEEIGWKDEAKPANEPMVKLLEFDPDGEDKVIAGIVYGQSHDPFDVVLGRVKKMSAADKEKIVAAAINNRTQKYYKVPRGFENTYLRFEILMNIGAWRDLHRHRMHTQQRQLFTIHNGFDVPEGLKEAGLDGMYSEAIKRAEELFLKIERHSKELAQYCTVMGHKIRFQQYQNMRAFFWEAELRTIAQGHPDYRHIEHEKIRLVQKIYPLLSKYLLVDMGEYDFARRGDSEAIARKTQELKDYFGSK